VSVASRLKYFYFSYLSKPACDRILFQTIHRLRPSKILELGVHDGSRALRMISLCCQYRAADEIRYAGIDLFEARPEHSSAKLSLKQAHCLLKTSGARIQLIPGDPLAALSRTANSLRENDLVLISADQDPAALQRAWFYLPRMLHNRSMVLQQQASDGAEPAWQEIALEAVRSKAAEQQQRRRAA
jgi:hypothetical protein